MMKSNIYSFLKCCFVVCFLGVVEPSSAQSYNTEITTLTNFVKRMFDNEPFEGVKIIEDYDNCYLLCAVRLNVSSGNTSTTNRIANVKAMAEANRFLNGSRITSDVIVHTKTDNSGMSDSEIIESIHEHSLGYVRSLSLLTKVDDKDSPERVFIYYKKLEDISK